MKNSMVRGSLVFLLAMFTLGVAPSALAQSDPPVATAPAETQDPQQEEDLEPGKGKISEFGDTLAKFWSVSSAFQAVQSFDDNIFLTNSFRKSDTVTKLSGRATVAYRGQHTRFEASYLPEFNIYQRYEPLNYSSHNYNHSFQHDFSRRLAMHWNVSVMNAPSRGNLPFKTLNFGGLRFNYYSLEALNDGLNIFNGNNVIGVSYRFSPRLKVTGTLEGATSRFTVRGNPAVSPVSNELIYSAGGKVAAEYSLNARQSVGVTVGNTYFGSVSAAGTLGTNSHQHHQTVRFTYSHRLPSKFTFNASVGPGITERSGNPDPQLGVFFDVGIGRQLARTGFALAFERSTQVGLLQESVTGYGFNGRVNRSFGRKWTTNLGGAYHRAEGSTGTHQLESLTGNAQIGYRLTSHISPFINYGYMHQKSLVPNPNTRNVNRNEVSIGFVYNFGVIAGR